MTPAWPPRRLELKLTESVLMQDTDQTATILQRLKDKGIQIAVDDFGTGYSSLGFLLRFPIDTIKIDRSFVQEVNSAAGEAIVTTVIAIGRNLKHRVVVEGVETPEQLSFHRVQQCDMGQGFHFSHPMPAEDFTACMGNGHDTLPWQQMS